MTGLIVCIAALVAGGGAGLLYRARNGRMRAMPAARNAGPARAAAPAHAPAGPVTAAALTTPAGAGLAGDSPAGAAVAGADLAGADLARADLSGADLAEVATRDGGRLSAAEIGQPLGERATLVQFSTSFCAPCRATRQVLAEVARMTDGVAHVEIDAESRLDLVRQLDVRRTPTVLVLGPDGQISQRASGQPRKADVIAAIGHVSR